MGMGMGITAVVTHMKRGTFGVVVCGVVMG